MSNHRWGLSLAVLARWLCLVLAAAQLSGCLSGGGSSGAFGAGVLAGWTEAGTRPKFDIVTGISTGALIAPFAFLGSDYDKPLSEAFTTVGDDDIFKWTGLRGVLKTGAFTSNEPLRKMLDKYITDDVINQVAVEYSKGR